MADEPTAPMPGRSPLPCHLYLPPAPQGPLLVLVHGASTRPERLIAYAAVAAARRGAALLAPDFRGFSGYQRLKGPGGRLDAAFALRRAVEAARLRHGLAPGPFDLMGFSAGAQFAHRFALHFPTSVRRLIVASAGWHTWLDRRLAYPAGLGADVWAPNEPDLEAFLRLPILVTVGEKDVERGDRFRTSPELDRRQGAHRLERARRWFDHLSQEALQRGVADRFEFRLLPNTGHSLKEAVRKGALVDRSFEFLSRPERETVVWPADRTADSAEYAFSVLSG